MDISLSGLSWELKGYWPYVPIKEKSMETGQTLQGVTDWIPAKVPGGVHCDLWRAGLIEDPYFGQNSLKCEWVENRWWMYRTAFPGTLDGTDLTKERTILTFQGLDYEAEVFFNDESCGSHTGMYTPFEVDLTGKIRDENRLVVLLKGVPQEMGQIGFTSRTFTQKSRFNYKWDFSTRLVNIGIWQDVKLHLRKEAELSELHIDTDFADGKGKIFVSALAEDFRKESGRGERKQDLAVKLTVEGPYLCESEDVAALKGMARDGQKARAAAGGEKPSVRVSLTVPVKDGRIDETLELNAPALWNPNGCGQPWLYGVRMELTEGTAAGGRVLDSMEKKTGIRSLSMAQNEGAPEGALPYTFVVNGRKIYIKGVNMTPLDHLYGTVTKEQYSHLVTAMVNAGVNLVRVWGGGLIEKEEFYDLCDENGILIWQEFIQSSSGIDNLPSRRPEFLRLLEETSVWAVKEKRNHVSLAVYSGGNELMDAPDRPCGLENETITMLLEIVRRYDGRRPFLPTSASGPREYITREKGVSHDVHGNWRYEGNPGHYELYGQSDNLFHSEFGMDAVSCVKSLRKFLPESSLRPTPMTGDLTWQHHGEWWGTYYRDCGIFGPIEKTPENLELFARCSQYMQSEGLRFILEADRKRAFHNSGVIIWQLNEPWPNASCTNLIDWYQEPKTAYYQTKRAYEPRHVSLDYRSLTLSGKTSMDVYVENDEAAFSGRIRALVRTLSGETLQEETLFLQVPENGSVCAGRVTVEPREGEELIFVTLLLEADGETVSENTYLFGTKEQEVLSPLRKTPGRVELVRYSAGELAGGRMALSATVRNAGTRAVLDAGAELAGEGYALLGGDNDRVLFPGEERTFRFLAIPKRCGGFSQAQNSGGAPALKLHWL